MKLKNIFRNLGRDGNGDYVVKNLWSRAKDEDEEEIEERTITRFRTKVNLSVDIDTEGTVHSSERQGERGIDDKDIRATVFKATEQILQNFLDGKIKENKPFHIYDPSNDNLNLVATFSMNNRGTPERISIITAIRKKNFIPRNITRTIKI